MTNNSINNTVNGLLGSFGADFDADSNKIINLTNPTLAQDAATKSYVDNLAGAASENVIIGGNFGTNPWQRGTSFTNPPTNSFSADRFKLIYSNTAARNINRTQDTPTVAEAGVYSEYCLDHSVTTSDVSIASGDFEALAQKIEGFNFTAIAQKEFTISFWVKATVTGTYGVSCYSSGANVTFVSEYTVNTTNTWEKKTLLISASPSSGAWNYTNGEGLEVRFAIAAGSTYQTTPGSWNSGNFLTTSNQVNGLSSSANNFKLQLVKIEPGPVATPFPLELESEILNDCLRYYWNEAVYNGPFTIQKYVAGVYFNSLRFPSVMRTAPTVILFNPNNGATGQIFNQSSGGNVAASVGEISELNYAPFLTAGGFTVGQAAEFYIIASAEL